MFPNLDAEMRRIRKTQDVIANIIQKNPSTVSDKMNGKADFKLTECKKIRNELFPELTLDYLFETQKTKN